MQDSLPAPLTRAESSQFEYTSLHRDVLEFVEALRARGDRRLHIGEFGVSPEGRSLPLLVLSEHEHFTPEEAHGSGLPVVLVINGIHAGEVEGKEASLMLVRDILDGRHGDLLSHMTLVVVPLFNPDGNDRIDPKHRALDIAHLSGQLGPTTGVGTRTNAAGINLNRDYLRQDALEMQLLMQKVALPWNAHLVVDCHATNGSIHRFALTYDIPHTAASGRPEPIAYMRDELLPAVTRAVKESAGLDTFYYGNFLRDEGGEGTGWITYTHHPRFGGNYRGLTNRLDLLLETYAYLPFEERVTTTYAFLRETLRFVAGQAERIVQLLARCSDPLDEIAVRYRLEPIPGRTVTVLTREPYTLEGAPIEVQVPHLAHFVPEATVRRPIAYAVPEPIAARLLGHGLTPEPALPGTYRVEIATVAKPVAAEGRGILESKTSTHLEATYEEHQRALPEGWRVVRTDNQYGAIAVYLCEAGSDDGLVACGWLEEPGPGVEFPAWRVLDYPGPAAR
ncbi:MAG: peptidase [Planctomycetaceae bacterium]|nr:peptidase [Planctomycetaceae bacterium]